MANESIQIPNTINTATSEDIGKSIIKTSHVFRIEDASCIEEPVENFVFDKEDGKSFKWKFTIWMDSDGNICLHIYLEEYTNISADGLKCHQYTTNIKVSNDKQVLKEMSTIFRRTSENLSQVICEHNLVEALVNDTLAVTCYITMIMKKSSKTSVKAVEEFANPHSKEDFSQFLEMGKFSDMLLVVEDQELKVHKVILAQRSEYFETMFSHENMKENILNRVEIKDFSFDVIKEVLLYIYSGKSINLEKMAADLFPAADKYALTTLRDMCQAVLERDLNADTAVQSLILADRHDMPELRSRSLRLIKRNIKSIAKTEDWLNLKNNYPNIVIELISLK